MSESTRCAYAKELERALMEYIERYGLTDKARQAFTKCKTHGYRCDREG